MVRSGGATWWVRAGLALAAAWWSAPAAVAGDGPARPAGPLANVTYGQAMTPVDRAEVFEFDGEAGRPAIRRISRDRYEIRFTAKSACDATVVIENAAGRVVRHLASGVLGKNAPAPFAAGTLAQTLVWDGKDNLGRYVRDPSSHTVRVMLGLEPTFDKVIGWHPKDTLDRGRIGALAADAGGVYVFEPSDRNRIKVFGHDARYLRTILPVPADTIGAAAQKMPLRTLEDGRAAPILCGLMGQHPFAEMSHDAIYYNLAAGGGWLVGFTRGAPLYKKRLMRLRTDGTSGGLSPYGKELAYELDQFVGHCELCLSPDAKWIYVSGLPSGSRSDRTSANFRHAVMRFAFDDAAPMAARDDSFVGEVVRNMPHGSRPELRTRLGAGSDNAHFNEPKGVATDAAGNLYVCDYGNDRVQVFGPDARHLKTIPIQRPRQIAVSPATGEIYVLSFQADSLKLLLRGEEGIDMEMQESGFVVTRLGPMADPKVVWTHRFDERQIGGGGMTHAANPYWPIFAVDFWTDPVRVWVVRAGGRIQVWDDTGKDLKLFDDFLKDVAATGLRPQMLHWHKMNRLVADPTRSMIYVSRMFNWMRVDPEDGRRWETLSLLPGLTSVLGAVNDLNVGYHDGLLYVRCRRFLLRYDPTKFTRQEGATRAADLAAEESAEVPIDYGEPVTRADVVHGGRLARSGVLLIPAQAGANGYDNGFDVSANGGIVALVKNIQDASFMGDYYFRGKGCYVAPLETNRFMPKVYVGRPWLYQELVWRWDKRGELTSDDLVPGLPANTEGVRMDLAGNVYVGVGRHLNENGKAHFGGTVVRFNPGGGRFICEGAKPAPLSSLPDAPPDFFIENPQGRERTWAVGMQWGYPGLDQVHYAPSRKPTDPYPCLCANCRFDGDPFGRSFVPKAYQYTVGIVDANGNRICEVGRYGNADSGRGPDSPVKIGGAEIALAGCSDVSVTDRYLYLNDDGNGRIVRVRLDYHAEQRLPVPEQDAPPPAELRDAG